DVDEVLDEVVDFYFSINKEEIYSIVKEKIESKQFDCNELVLSSKIVSLKKKPNHFQFLFERRGKKFYRFTTERIEKAFNDLRIKNTKNN
ncbi:MAG: hypothetical protein KAS30_01275, partial [Candidatus Diapherotrites archaeon]|nr:hypothetical protein [Candidatus Diapherotrites archaeon]